jgi:predicted porin
LAYIVKLTALATLAAASASFAQSSVTVFGTFDPSIANQKTTYGSGNSVTQNYIRNNSQGTSQLSVKGVEDLGGGLKASFMLENDFDTRFDANGNPYNGKVNLGSGGGEQYVGLEGSFGALKVGGANTPTLTTQASRQPIGTKIGSGFGGVMGASHVRNNNSLVYSTPVFSGFSAAVGYAFKTNADVNPAGTYNISTGVAAAAAGANNGLNGANVGDVTDLGVNYANGPFRAGLSNYTVGAAVAGAIKNVQNNVYAQYDIAGATLYVGFHDEKAATTGNKSTGSNFAVKYALTPSVNLLANYGKLNDKSSANADKEITAIGAQYLLSNRSSLYARYVDEKNDNVTAASSAKGVKTTLVGLQHNF